MASYYLTEAVLTANGLRVANDSKVWSFAELGLAPDDTLRLFARSVNLESLPANNDVEIYCSVISGQPGERRLVGTPTRPRPLVTIYSHTWVGDFSIICQGIKGETGPKGLKGMAAQAPPHEQGENHGHDTEEGGPGGPGGKGFQGGVGGRVVVVFVNGGLFGNTASPNISAPGGDGGAGGPGGVGGDGFPADNKLKRGPSGPPGPAGDPGPIGEARVERLDGATFLQRLKNASSPSDYQTWFQHFLDVAEYLYRHDGDANHSSRAYLGFVEQMCLDPSLLDKAQALRIIISMGNTITGYSREQDVAPNITFAADQIEPVKTSLLAMLEFAQVESVKANIASASRGLLEQRKNELENHRAALVLRLEDANRLKAIAAKRWDNARQREENIKQDYEALKTQIEQTDTFFGPGSSFLGNLGEMFKIGAAVVTAGTGIGGVMAVGEGLMILKKAGGFDPGDNLFESIDKFKKLHTEGKTDTLVKGFKDIADGSKPVLGFGKILQELGAIEASADKNLGRELASLGREYALAIREAAVAHMEADRADLGIKIATAELQGHDASIDYIKKQMSLISTDISKLLDYILGFVDTAKRLGDILADRLFFTMRAKEIYLGLDERAHPPYDFCRIHPDAERLFVASRATNSLTYAYIDSAKNHLNSIINWGSIYKEIETLNSFDFVGVSEALVSIDGNTAELLAGLKSIPKDGEPLVFTVDDDSLADPNLYEVRFVSVTVRLTGASVQETSGRAILLTHTGSCSLRRAPRPGIMLDEVKALFLEPTKTLISCQTDAPGQVSGSTIELPKGEPPTNIQNRPFLGQWGISFPRPELWDLSGLQSLQISFKVSALRRKNDTGNNIPIGQIVDLPPIRVVPKPVRFSRLRPPSIIRLPRTP